MADGTGVYEGVMPSREGQLSLEMRCRPPGSGSGARPSR
jgi:hypothetical protein